MKRVFAAIKIQPSELFQNIYNQIRSHLKDEKIKWVELQNIHITLKFFGEMEEDKIINIKKLLGEIAYQHQPFEMNIQHVGVFGSSYNPKVIWFGLEKNKHLLSLGLDIFKQMENIGFKTDRQNFVPHLTVGRIKQLKDKNQFQQVIEKYKILEIQKMDVMEFQLIESTLTPKGPIYKILKNFLLK